MEREEYHGYYKDPNTIEFKSDGQVKEEIAEAVKGLSLDDFKDVSKCPFCGGSLKWMVDRKIGCINCVAVWIPLITPNDPTQKPSISNNLQKERRSRL